VHTKGTELHSGYIILLQDNMLKYWYIYVYFVLKRSLLLTIVDCWMRKNTVGMTD